MGVHTAHIAHRVRRRPPIGRQVELGTCTSGPLTPGDLEALALPGSTMRWRFRHFGADRGRQTWTAPTGLLLADHRPTGTVLPIYAVVDLGGAVDALRRSGLVG